MAEMFIKAPELELGKQKENQPDFFDPQANNNHVQPWPAQTLVQVTARWLKAFQQWMKRLLLHDTRKQKYLLD